MKALILALLPGLDEETGEFFDKVRSWSPFTSRRRGSSPFLGSSQVVFLLDFVSSTVSPPFFLQNLWLILISTPSARITALNYLSRRMPKLGEGEGSFHPLDASFFVVEQFAFADSSLPSCSDIVPIVGPDIGLMIRAFASSLEDDNLLVQRGILDLLVTSLRLDGAASAKFVSFQLSSPPSKLHLTLTLLSQTYSGSRSSHPYAVSFDCRPSSRSFVKSASLHLAPRIGRQPRLSGRSSENSRTRPATEVSYGTLSRLSRIECSR